MAMTSGERQRKYRKRSTARAAKMVQDLATIRSMLENIEREITEIRILFPKRRTRQDRGRLPPEPKEQGEDR